MNTLGTLHTILRTARSWGYLPGEFTESQLTIPNERMRSAVRFFSGEHARQIIEAAEQPWRTLFAIAAMTGLRPGEVLGLMWEDVDLEQGLSHVRRSAAFDKLRIPKTKSSVATAPIPEPLRLLLKEYLSKWKPNPVGFLVATRSGRPHMTN